jgi:uncharacterized protein (TIGR00369 family)
MKSFQDFYPEELSHCYGCGRNNNHGLQLKSYWKGEKSIAFYKPQEYHIAVPGYVYGGLLASIVDCHGTGTAAAASYRFENREMDSEPTLRFVTAKLEINYLKPTPLGIELKAIGTVLEVTEKKVVTDIDIFANDLKTISGKVIAVRMPENMSR